MSSRDKKRKRLEVQDKASILRDIDVRLSYRDAEKNGEYLEMLWRIVSKIETRFVYGMKKGINAEKV